MTVSDAQAPSASAGLLVRRMVGARNLRIRQVRLTSRILRGLAHFKAGRSVIRRSRRMKMGRVVLDAALGYGRPFATLKEAEAAVAPYTDGGHSSAANVMLHLEMARKPRPSDYAALFHISKEAGLIRTVFDFGGNVGNLYYCYSNLIKFPDDLVWTVYDLPENLSRGRRLADDNRETSLRFTDRLTDASGVDVFIASGSLHYFDSPLPAIIESLPIRPRRVLVNRTPLTQADNIAVIQDAGSFRVACMLYNRDELLRSFVKLGYRVIAAWDAAELKLEVPASPDHSIGAYSGFWLELNA